MTRLSNTSQLPDRAGLGRGRSAAPPEQGGEAVALQRGWLSRGLIVDRYFFGYILNGTMRGILWFAGLLVTFAVISSMTRIMRNSLQLSDLAELVIYQIPRIVLFTLPMSLLNGTVQTFADLSSRGEITAMWAGGMSFPRMMRAPFMIAAVVALLALVLQEVVVPRAEMRKNQVLDDKIQQAAGVQDNFSMMTHRPDGSIDRMVWADRFNIKYKTLVKPRIQLYNEDHEIFFEVSGQRAIWNIKTGKWVFFHGESKTFPTGKAAAETFSSGSTFDKLELDVVPQPDALKMKGTSMEEHLTNGDFELVSISDLAAYRDGLKRLPTAATVPIRKRIDGATFGIHQKISTPLIAFALVLLGAPLGLRPQRSSGGFAMGLSLAVLLLYYIVWSWMSQVGTGGLANPYLMAYLPMSMTGLIGLALCYQKSR